MEHDLSLLVPKLRLGTRGREALLPVSALRGSRASRRAFPSGAWEREVKSFLAEVIQGFDMSTVYPLFSACGAHRDLGRQHGEQARAQVRGFLDYLAHALSLSR